MLNPNDHYDPEIHLRHCRPGLLCYSQGAAKRRYDLLLSIDPNYSGNAFLCTACNHWHVGSLRKNADIVAKVHA